MDPRVASIPQFCFPDLKNGMSASDYREQHAGYSARYAYYFYLRGVPGVPSVSVVLQSFVQINTLSNNVLVQLLLYGDKDLSSDVNKRVLELTLNFIHQTGRFD